MKLIMLAAGQKAVPATHLAPRVPKLLHPRADALPLEAAHPHVEEKRVRREEEDVAERHFSRRRARTWRVPRYAL